MKLIEINVGHFGRLSEMQLNLKEGFHLIYGANEKGKSTLMAFIRAMLYGLAGSRRQLIENDRRRYMPWDGSKMGGYLILENNGSRYRLERRFGQTKAGDHTELMDDISGRSITLASSDEPGLKLLNLTENEFINTVFVSQLSSTIGTSEDLLGRLSNLAGSGDMRVSQLEVDNRLKKAQVDLVAARGQGGRLNEARSLLLQLQEERESAVREALLQEERLGRLEEMKTQLRQKEEARLALADEARWQDELDFLEKYGQMCQRQRQLATEKEKLRLVDNQLKNGDFKATRDFLKQGLQLEQAWQNAKAQIMQARQQTERSRQMIEDLNQRLQKYGPVLGIEHSQLKKLQQLLAEQRREAEKRSHQLGLMEAEKNRQREKDNTQAMTFAAENVSDARQRLQNIENDVKTVIRDLEHLDEQSRRIETEYERITEDSLRDVAGLKEDQQAAEKDLSDLLSQIRHLQSGRDASEKKLAALKQNLRSRRSEKPKTRSKQAAALITGVILLLAGSAAAVLVNPLAWAAAAAGFAITAAGLAYSLQSKGGQSDGIFQELQLLESEIRIADSQFQSLDQLRRYAENNLVTSQQRLSQSMDDERRHQDKFAEKSRESDLLKTSLLTNKTRLENLMREAADAVTKAEIKAKQLREEIDQQEPVSLADGDLELQDTFRKMEAYKKQIQDLTDRSGCTSAEQLSSLLQETDELRSKLKIYQEEHRHDQNELASKEDNCQQAKEKLLSWLQPYLLLEDPREAAHVLEQLSEHVDAAETMSAQVRHQEQAFDDRLDDLSWKQWQEKAEQINQQLEETTPRPLYLGKEDREMMAAELENLQIKLAQIREDKAALESEIRHFGQNRRSVSEIDERIAHTQNRIDSMDAYYRILSQVRQSLEAAADEMQSSFGPALNRAAAENLARLTCSRYEDLKVDRAFDVKVADPVTSRLREWQYLSGGTVDQVYLALRLAISDQISETDNRPSLLLDDILIQYDESRAEAALDWLMQKSCRENQQILLFTCQERMVSKVKAAGLPVLEI